MSKVYGKTELVSSQLEPDPSAWSSRLETGIPLIDTQHKRCFELAASLGEDGHQASVMSTLAQLNRYVSRHFRDEEAVMALYGYPGIEAHRLLHQEFRAMLADLLQRAGAMTLDRIAAEARNLVVGWVHPHIMTADAEYLPYVRDPGAGGDAPPS